MDVAIRGAWHTWRIVVDKATKTAAYFQNGEFLACRDVDPASFSGTQIKLGSNGICCGTPANASWKNVRVVVPD